MQFLVIKLMWAKVTGNFVFDQKVENLSFHRKHAESHKMILEKKIAKGKEPTAIIKSSQESQRILYYINKVMKKKNNGFKITRNCKH